MNLKHSLLAVSLLAAASTFGQPLVFTFDSDAQNFQNFVWTPGPSGWSGGGAIQAPSATGGWTLGGSFNYYHEFDWVSGQQPIVQSLVASGAQLSFDLIVDGTSFNPGAGVWYDIVLGGNSPGSHGWTQTTVLSAWHNADDSTLVATHVDLTFAQLGWSDPEDAGGWFQLYFGSNSDASQPVRFYVDNVTLSAVPEPSSFALCGLGAAAMMIFRRRK